MIGDKSAWWAFEADLVAALKETGMSQRGALGLLGISRGSWHERHHPSARAADPVPHDQRRSAAWLSLAETAAILGWLAAAFSLGKSVYQAFYEALDAGTPIASLSSWYRIAKGLDPHRPTRRRARRRSSALPQWEATGPMQVWSWDITKLKGPYTRLWYDFYVVIDVFSRKIVGWRIEDVEDPDLAQEMFEAAIADHDGVVPRIMHSDGGSAMKSKTLARFFADLAVTMTRNRPRVSNDNPYSESWFKTAKYHPSAPAFFHDIDHARAWASEFVAWYNQHHRHSSLEGHTPASVHDGTWVQIHHARQDTMDQLAAASPERYRRPTKLKTPNARVTLNTQNTDERLRTG